VFLLTSRCPRSRHRPGRRRSPHRAPRCSARETRPLDRTADGYTITDPETGRTLHFTEDGRLEQLDDRNRNWITVEYTADGTTPSALAHSGGPRLRVTTADGRVIALHLCDAAPDGSDQEVLRHGYTDGHLTAVTNSSGTPLRFGYDTLGRRTGRATPHRRHHHLVLRRRRQPHHHVGLRPHHRLHPRRDGPRTHPPHRRDDHARARLRPDGPRTESAGCL
jgi:YD repeat-containing protein